MSQQETRLTLDLKVEVLTLLTLVRSDSSPCFLISPLRSLSMASSVATSRGSSPSLFTAPTWAPCSIRYLQKQKQHTETLNPEYSLICFSLTWHQCHCLLQYPVETVNTHLAIWMKPQEAAACRGVQPSLSPLLTSLPLSTRNCTISAFSSMQACQRTHSHTTGRYTYKCLLFTSFIMRIRTTHVKTKRRNQTEDVSEGPVWVQ